jgi:hypothetical protein
LTRRPGRPDQILGARVVLTARNEASEPELDRVLEEIAGPDSLTSTQLPIVVLEKASREKAEWARDLLTRAGGTVSVEDVWVTREEVGSFRSRPECPSCGSGHTQPYLHAGPGSRVNMKCTNCGHLFRAQTAPE